MIKLIGLLGIPLLVLGLIGAVHGHPIADPGGPYTFEFGDDWVLDASASYDTEGPLMNIVYYEWALENDGKPPEWPSNSPITVIQWYQLEQDGVGVLGTHTIGLIVENDWGDQSDWQETTVDVVESLPGPVPAPSGVLLLGTGLLGLMGIRRRTTKRRRFLQS